MITLDAHQREAVDWLKSRSGQGLVYADAGTGKTFISVAFALESELRKVLIVCPATLKLQWQAEIKKFCGEDAVVIDGSASERRVKWRTGARFHIANYEILYSDSLEVDKFNPDAVIADECHMVNSPTAKRTKAFKRIKSPIRIALSGDPFPNGPWEAYSVMDWIKPGILGANWWSFRAGWCQMHPHIKQAIVGIRDKEAFRRTISPLIHRIHKEEVLVDLPGKKEVFEWVELGDLERKAYEQLEKELRVIVEGKEKLTVTNLLSLILRLRQMIDEPEVFGVEVRPAKQEKLDIIVKDGRKTLIFTEFSALAHSLSTRYKCPLIAGNVTLPDRNKAVEKFMNDEDCRILVSTAAGGYGLNLTAATRVIHFGLPYNNARVNQRVSRAWRRGQTEEVEEVYLLARRTVDEKILKIVERKKDHEKKFSKSELKAIIL